MSDFFPSYEDLGDTYPVLTEHEVEYDDEPGIEYISVEIYLPRVHRSIVIAYRVDDERSRREAYACLWDYMDTLNNNERLLYGST